MIKTSTAMDSSDATYAFTTRLRGRNPARRLVLAIIRRARAAGIGQAELARAAGISPEALSRLKREGRCRLTTALALAEAAGFEQVVLAAGPPAGSAASVAAKKLGASRRRDISVEALIRALSGAGTAVLPLAHLVGFFEELPLELVHDVALDEGLNYEVLARLADQVGAEGEIVEWLKEMAGHGVAQAS